MYLGDKTYVIQAERLPKTTARRLIGGIAANQMPQKGARSCHPGRIEKLQVFANERKMELTVDFPSYSVSDAAGWG